jgi:hypothetical protein
MSTDIRTGRPQAIVDAERVEQSRQKQQSLEDERIRQQEAMIGALNSESGRLLVDQLLKDYQEYLDKFHTVPAEELIEIRAVMGYISNTLKAMGFTAQINELSRANLKNKTVGSLMHGSRM